MMVMQSLGLLHLLLLLSIVCRLEWLSAHGTQALGRLCFQPLE